MRRISRGPLAIMVGLGLSLTLSAQGGGRAAAQNAGGQAGRGRGAQAGGGARGGGAPETAGDFYDFETGAVSAAPIPDAPPIESHQKITVGGQILAYTARAGYLAIRSATTGQSQAHLFFTYYAKDGATETARPILFVVGGAPGVAAAWQEFAGLGPKKIALAPDGGAGLPPYRWIDNPDTPLDAADLVFVNPVGTAYSRPDNPALGPEFWNTRGDSAALAEFVRTFLTTFDRWNSARLLLGDDLDTARVSSLALYLTEHQIPVNGVAVLSLAVSADSTAGDAEYLTLMPTETLAAWVHHKLPADLQALPADQVADRAREFASREYLHALYKGDRLPADERSKAIADLAHLTGVSTTFVANNELRLPWDRFSEELFRGQHGSMALSDDRAAGFEPRGGGRGRGGRGGFGAPAPPFDAAENELASGVLGAYTNYLKHDLGFSSPGVFYLLNGGTGAFTAAATDDATLSDLLARNPRMHVLVAVDYFDAGLPFYAAEFTLAHLQIAPGAAENIREEHFESGRAVFADPKAAAKLHTDLRKLIVEATGPVER